MESATEPRGLPDVRPARELDRREREILAFEGQWWKYAGAKEQAVRELFDMSATRYYQVLNALIDKPEALAVDPLLVRRLRRLRTGRARDLRDHADDHDGHDDGRHREIPRAGDRRHRRHAAQCGRPRRHSGTFPDAAPIVNGVVTPA